MAEEDIAHNIPLRRGLRDYEDVFDRQGNTEQYDRIYENEFLAVTENPLSTFSIDVDTASYSNMRRFLNAGKLPPPSSVRVEEFINYFRFADRPPEGHKPFHVTTEVADCP